MPPTMRKAESFRSHFFRFADNGNRVTEVVQRLHGVYVDADTLLSQQFHQLRISSAPLVAWNIKGYNSIFAEFFQRLIDWRSCLIKTPHFKLVPSYTWAAVQLVAHGQTPYGKLIDISAAEDFYHFTAQVVHDLQPGLGRQLIDVAVKQVILQVNFLD